MPPNNPTPLAVNGAAQGSQPSPQPSDNSESVAPTNDRAFREAVQREVRRIESSRAKSAPTPKAPISEAQLGEACQDWGPRGEAPLLGLGRDARASSKKVASKIQENVRKLQQNPTENVAKMLLAAGKIARESMTQQIEALDGLINTTARHVEELDRDIRSQMNPASGELRQQLPELRTAMRSMSDEQRERVLHNTQGEDYEAVIYAVASAPAWASGVDEGQRMQIKSHILGLRKPELLYLPKQHKQELELLKKCREGFERSVNEMIDFKSVDALRSLADGAP